MKDRVTHATAMVGDIKVDSGGQVQKVITGSIARTDLTAKVLGTIPASGKIIGVKFYTATASNAGSTATLSLGKQGGTGVEYLNAHSVLTGTGQVTPTTDVVLGTVGTAAVTLTGIYAETGTASSAGGPWTVVVEFVSTV